MYKLIFGYSKEREHPLVIEGGAENFWNSSFFNSGKDYFSFCELGDCREIVIWNPSWKSSTSFLENYADIYGFNFGYCILRISDIEIKGVLNQDAIKHFLMEFFDQFFSIEVYRDGAYLNIALIWKRGWDSHIEISHTLLNVLTGLLRDSSFVEFINNEENHKVPKIRDFFRSKFIKPEYEERDIEEYLIKDYIHIKYEEYNYKLQLGVLLSTLLLLILSPSSSYPLFRSPSTGPITAWSVVNISVFKDAIAYAKATLGGLIRNFYACILKSTFSYKTELVIKIMLEEGEYIENVVDIGKLKNFLE